MGLGYDGICLQQSVVEDVPEAMKPFMQLHRDILDHALLETNAIIAQEIRNTTQRAPIADWADRLKEAFGMLNALLMAHKTIRASCENQFPTEVEDMKKRAAIGKKEFSKDMGREHHKVKYRWTEGEQVFFFHDYDNEFKDTLDIAKIRLTALYEKLNLILAM